MPSSGGADTRIGVQPPPPSSSRTSPSPADAPDLRGELPFPPPASSHHSTFCRHEFHCGRKLIALKYRTCPFVTSFLYLAYCPQGPSMRLVYTILGWSVWYLQRTAPQGISPSGQGFNIVLPPLSPMSMVKSMDSRAQIPNVKSSLFHLLVVRL